MATRINSPTYPPTTLTTSLSLLLAAEAIIHYSVFLLSFLLCWALYLYFGLRPGVAYICLLGFFSTINNLLFHQWSLCVCVINQKEFLLLIIKKKTKKAVSLSAADLKIVNQWSLSTSKNYQISFWSLFFFVFFHFFFISSRSDHNFIPVYPKFTRKAEAKRNRPNLKNRSWFLELYGPIMVRTGPYFFYMHVFFFSILFYLNLYSWFLSWLTYHFFFFYFYYNEWYEKQKGK